MAVSQNLRDALEIALVTPNNTQELIAEMGAHTSVSGVDKSIQYNNSGAFGGNSVFTYDDVSGAMVLKGITGTSWFTMQDAAGLAINKIGRAPGGGGLYTVYDSAEVAAILLRGDVGSAFEKGMAAGTDALDATAILEGKSTTLGFLPPRMTTAQRNAIGTPTEGLMVYNSDNERNEFKNGAFWEGMATAGVTLTDAANVAWDASNEVAILTMNVAGATRVIDNPTNTKLGGTYVIILKQDASGSRAATWGANFKWKGGTAPTLSAGANAVDIVTFISDGTNLYGVDSLNFS